jgi:DNA-binding response OmpR family regulator
MNDKTTGKALRANGKDASPTLLMIREQAQHTLGRSTECNVVIARPFASRVHATVAFDGNYCLLTDNQSANGTFVNGRPVRDSHRLKHGDEIGLGDPTGVLVFFDEDKTVQPVSHLRFDFGGWRFFWRNEPIPLSHDQQNLLLHLFERRGEACDKTSCARAVWGHDYNANMDAYALDQIVSRLRAKLRGVSEEAGDLVVTLRGSGYLLKPPG